MYMIKLQRQKSFDHKGTYVTLYYYCLHTIHYWYRLICSYKVTNSIKGRPLFKCLVSLKVYNLLPHSAVLLLRLTLKYRTAADILSEGIFLFVFLFCTIWKL